MIKNDPLLVNYLDQGDCDKSYKLLLENMGFGLSQVLYFLLQRSLEAALVAVSRDTGF